MQETTMTLNQFTDSLVMRLEELTEPDVKISLRTVTKNNGIRRTGCSIEKSDSRIAPVFYMEDYYIDYLRGSKIDDIANTLMSCARSNDGRNLPDMSFFDDYETVKKDLAVKLIGTEQNREKLKDIPNRTIEDMSVTCYWLAGDPQFDRGTIEISNSMMKSWNISKEQLLHDAFTNSCRILPPSFMNIRDVLGIAGQTDEPENMFVLTNERDSFGASAMLYPGLLKKYAVTMAANLYILPSSVNEVILIPEKEDVDYSGLQSIVKEINRTEVDPEEVLTDSVYYYNRFTDTFHIA